MPENYRLFILDDDTQYTELLTDVARNEGWDVDHSTEAKSFLQKNIPEQTILVLDLVLPDIDGIEVIRALAARKCYCPLILISGFDNKVLHSAQQLAEAHKIPVIATLTKPFELSKFVTLLANLKTDFVQREPGSSKNVTFFKKELEQALTNHEFILHYQPQIDLNTQKVQGIEALVRWNHPHLGLVYPDKFISLIEEFDLIDQLTSCVLTMACEHLKQLKVNYSAINLSINVTADNIVSLAFPERLKDITAMSGIDASAINLELTESAVMGHLTSSLDVLNRLRMKGFHLSIDDFGTGYSSLQQLYQAPFDELKIDRAFTAKMLDDNEAMIIVKICIMLGKMLNMKTLAEGVENEEIFAKLKELECDFAQGYYIAKPMSFAQLTEWLLLKT